MANKDLPVVINEAISTGVVRIELFGDKVVARTHIHEARKLTAQLRAMYGVTQRIADGESGGFYQHTVELPDGTTLIATTNNGQDSVSIFAVSEVVEQVEEVTVEEPTDLIFYEPTVWIGARRVSGGESVRVPGWFPAVIHLCVWEPVDPTKTDSGNDTLIVSNRDDLYSSGIRNAVRDDRDIFPLGWVEDFPEGVSKLEILPDYTDSEDVFWDIVIKTPDNTKPNIGRYNVRLMLQGDDCTEITPFVVEVKAVVFDRYKTLTREVVTQETLDEMTDYNKIILPKGWFNEGAIEDKSTQCSVLFNKEDDFGVNPYPIQWWQNGIVMSVGLPWVGPTPEWVPGSTVVLADTPEQMPPTGFDLNTSFPGRIDRGCAAMDFVQRVFGYARSDFTTGSVTNTTFTNPNIPLGLAAREIIGMPETFAPGPFPYPVPGTSPQQFVNASTLHFFSFTKTNLGTDAGTYRVEDSPIYPADFHFSGAGVDDDFGTSPDAYVAAHTPKPDPVCSNKTLEIF